MKKTIKPKIKAEKIKETIDTILGMENAPKIHVDNNVKEGVDLSKIAAKLTQRKAESMEDE